MAKGIFTKRDYERLLDLIRKYHETNSIASATDAMRLIIKGILTGKLTIKFK